MNATSPSRKKPVARAKVKGGGAVAQGKQAKSAGKRAVIVDGGNTAPIHTGSGDVYQTIVERAARPGASAADLRRAYLAYVSTRAEELPLFAGDSGPPIQLSSVYTALLTQAPNITPLPRHNALGLERPAGDEEHTRLSALEALDQTQCLVLMGGPGSGKTTFLNFVALCMAGEMLGTATNLKLLRSPVPPDRDARGLKPKAQRWQHQALLPVRVDLRDFAADMPATGVRGSADGLWDFIIKQFPDQLKPYADYLQAELLGKGGLILLDGLDEVPDALERREQVKHAVQELAGIYRQCRFLVTTRTYAYQRQDWKLSGFAERELLPFSPGQIERFIDCWYVHMTKLFRLTGQDASARAQHLKSATRRAELQELATRPLLLTLMARLQTKGDGSLPENREKLYAQSVDMLLEEWEGMKLRRDASGRPVVAEPSLSEWLNASRENIRRELDRLAYEAHLNQDTLIGTADIGQRDLMAALIAASKDQPDSKFIRLEQYLRDRAGLITSHGEGLYQFPHRSFQEYLAACHLARFDFPDTLSRMVKADPNRWREVTLLAAARSKGLPSAIWELAEELCAKDDVPVAEAPSPSEAAQWGALLAGQVLVDTGLAVSDPILQERHERKRRRVRDWQVSLLRSRVLSPRERALAGKLLVHLGETREHLIQVDKMRFCLVPRGAFWMGEEGNDLAQLHHNDGLDYDYCIGETPVTVAQFREFVTLSGYQQPSMLALGYMENRPVTWVTWENALAFCAWLTDRWHSRLPRNWCATLPSEAEWEKAARGGERLPVVIQQRTVGTGMLDQAFDLKENPNPKRAYPWGDDWMADNANVEMVVGDASTPGCFAMGHGPYGCEDMAGNLYEWTRSLWGKDRNEPDFLYPYQTEDMTREALHAGAEIWRVIRGGAYTDSRYDARCASRRPAHLDDQIGNVGFRVVLRCAPIS